MHHVLPDRDLVLLGAGNTHLHILRMWRLAPIPGVRLTCVNDFYTTAYSGMLTGTLAGLYQPEQMQIDLVRLCAAGGVRLLRAEATGLDLSRRELICDDRPALPFNVLSLGIGSVTRDDGLPLDDTVLRIKPMQTFLQRLDERLLEIAAETPDRALRVAAVGGGAGGVEIAFCLPARLQQLLPQCKFELSLFHSGSQLVAGAPRRTGKVALRELQRRGFAVKLEQAVRGVQDGEILFADGSRQPADLVIWSTGPQPPPLLGQLGLATDDEGFLLTHPTLQSVTDPDVFVVGDSGTIQDRPAPKAGVYAVREGPILWGNLHRRLHGRPLLQYKPQRQFLSIMTLGDRRALLSYSGLVFRGRWCWRLKDSIDRRFVEQYQDDELPPWRAADEEATAFPPAVDVESPGMNSGQLLSRVWLRLHEEFPEQVASDGANPGTLAQLSAPDPGEVAADLAGIPAFFDDPFLIGRVTAVHAANRFFAAGASPRAAMALATIPPGSAFQQEQTLYELLTGALHELRKMTTTLAGASVQTGPQLALGLSLLGTVSQQAPGISGGPRDGDCLVLTRPLGTAVLLAAQRQARLKAQWLPPLLDSLLATNQPAAELARELKVHALATVGDGGLAGCLDELLKGSALEAALQIDCVPLLPGVEEQMGEPTSDDPRQAVLSAKEISGGLLLAVPESSLEALLDRLAKLTDGPSRFIGRLGQREPAHLPPTFPAAAD